MDAPHIIRATGACTLSPVSFYLRDFATDASAFCERVTNPAQGSSFNSSTSSTTQNLIVRQHAWEKLILSHQVILAFKLPLKLKSQHNYISHFLKIIILCKKDNGVFLKLNIKIFKFVIQLIISFLSPFIETANKVITRCFGVLFHLPFKTHFFELVSEHVNIHFSIKKQRVLQLSWYHSRIIHNIKFKTA
jgi:hypothetical protein